MKFLFGIQNSMHNSINNMHNNMHNSINSINYKDAIYYTLIVIFVIIITIC